MQRMQAMQAQAKGRVQTTHFNTGNNDQPGPSTQQRNSSLNWGYLSKMGVVMWGR